MHLRPMVRAQFRRQSVDRQTGLGGDPALHPAFDIRQLAVPGVALRLRLQTSGLAFEPHQVVDELDGNAQPPGCFGVRVSLPDKRDGALA